MVKTYVKKPLPIEAIKFDGTNQQEICNWGQFRRQVEHLV